MDYRKVLIGVAIVVVLVVLGLFGYNQFLAPEEPTPTLPIQETAVLTINAEGRVLPVDSLTQAFELSGQVEVVKIEEGDFVDKGDLLIALNNEALLIQVEQARAAVKAAQAQFDMLPGYASEDQENHAEAQVEQALAALKAAVLMVRKAELLASISGRVVSIEVAEGEVVNAGMPVVVIADTSSWQVETVDLLEEDVVNIQIGQPAEVNIAAYPDQKFEGVIQNIAHSATSYQGNVTYQVTIDILSTHGLDLAWGMTCFVEIKPSDPDLIPTATAQPIATGEQDPPTATPEDNGSTITPAPTATNTSNTSQREIPLSYTVQQGEFVYCLGRRFDINPNVILSHNGLPSGTSLFTGQIIQLPQNAPPFPTSRALFSHPTTYIVKTQDTFHTIACQFGDVYPEQISQANGLTLESPLTPGQVLRIP